MTRRGFVAGGLGSAALLGSGCYGSFGLTNLLFDWNTHATDNKFVRALIFFALVVIPVYGLFLFIDAVILNTVEFWTDKPVVGNKRVAKLEGGRELTSIVTADPAVIRHELRENGKLLRVIYARRVGRDQVELLDEHMQVLTRAHVAESGKTHVTDGKQRVLAVLEPEQLDAAERAVHGGMRPHEAARAQLQAAPVQGEALALALSRRA
ncbi:MAG TPA: DUF3332 family protein [Polyangiales bacterium]|nr:DUF3332 family protein [Polyangiales bacterium]